jgi:MFS family permease
MTLILTAPPFLLCTIVMFITGWHSDRVKERFWHIAVPLSVTILSMILAVATTNTGVRYFAMMLMVCTLCLLPHESTELTDSAFPAWKLLLSRHRYLDREQAFSQSIGLFVANTIIQWISQSNPRPAQKRAAVLAYVNSFANTPNIWCSYLYQDSMKPRYLEAFLCNIAACAIAIALAFGLKLYMKRENAKMDRGEPVKNVTQEMVNLGWRYLL